MNTPFLLFQIQKIDSRLTAIELRSREIVDLLNNDPVLAAARIDIDLARVGYTVAFTALQSFESKILERRNKLEQSESSLYGGKIKNPKELQDLQKEIASLRSIITAMEDEQMVLMLNLEEKENILNTANQKILEAEKNNKVANVDLTTQASALSQEKTRLTAERNLLSNQVPISILQRYDELASRKGGLAVAKVEDQTCVLCGTGLTPSQVQSAKSPSVLFFCPSCGRILYAD